MNPRRQNSVERLERFILWVAEQRQALGDRTFHMETQPGNVRVGGGLDDSQ